jgi:hypothetical protein
MFFAGVSTAQTEPAQSGKKNASATAKTAKVKKLRECPEQWCIDRKPVLAHPGEEAKAHEYYLLRGKRYDKEAFDHDWLAKNCQLELTIVR